MASMDDTIQLSVKLESGLTHHATAKPFSNPQLLALQMIGRVSPVTQMLLLQSAVQASIGDDAFGKMLVGMMEGTFTETDLTTLIGEITRETAELRERQRAGTTAAETPDPEASAADAG